jgi:hypothetical protein
MFESGKRQTNKKPKENNGGGEVCKLPTVEQVFEIWETHFEQLLKFSPDFDPILLQKFEKNQIEYVKTIK